MRYAPKVDRWLLRSAKTRMPSYVLILHPPFSLPLVFNPQEYEPTNVIFRWKGSLGPRSNRPLQLLAPH